MDRIVKAQQFFGGTSPNNTGKDKTQRQVGSATAGPGSNRGKADTNTHANLSTSKLVRPNIPGKVDNRKVGQ